MDLSTTVFTCAIGAAGILAVARYIEKLAAKRSDPNELCSYLPQIHQEEYPQQLKPRHEADVDEFSDNLDNVAKFYFKIVFRRNEPPADSLNAFLKAIGGEDQSNMDFGQLR